MQANGKNIVWPNTFNTFGPHASRTLASRIHETEKGMKYKS